MIEHRETDTDGGAPPEHRVRVWFGSHILCDYRADPIAAKRYAAAMARRFTGLRVTVHHTGTTETDGLRPLPCERLWTLTP